MNKKLAICGTFFIFQLGDDAISNKVGSFHVPRAADCDFMLFKYSNLVTVIAVPRTPASDNWVLCPKCIASKHNPITANHSDLHSHGSFLIGKIELAGDFHSHTVYYWS